MKPETKNYLKTIEKRNLKQDYSSDNIKKKKKGIGITMLKKQIFLN